VRRILIGTRGSTLALAQSTWVQQQIARHHREAVVELRVIKTSGDRFIDMPIPDIGGKGVFTKEIEDALLRGEIDLAVHSMKDLPTALPDGLAIAAVPKREDARDVLVTRTKCALRDLTAGARVGTGSLRRRAQLFYHRADLTLAPIRGNIDTRLRKLDEGEVDALIMAAAGLKRIGREDRIGEYLPDDVCVSAAAQGALGIESRDDFSIRELLGFVHDTATFAEVSAERSLLARLGGGCHVPIGARARVAGDQLSMIGVVASPDGSGLCRGEIAGPVAQADELGHRLGDQLVSQGAAKFLASALTYGATDATKRE
jgi:hydroxymethylbilane synthase